MKTICNVCGEFIKEDEDWDLDSVLTAVYVHLEEGNIDEARALIDSYKQKYEEKFCVKQKGDEK